MQKSEGHIGHALPTFRFLHAAPPRSEEHTSELQSHSDLVCRLLLEKKKQTKKKKKTHKNILSTITETHRWTRQ